MIKSPNKPKIEPADEDVKAALAEVADHPEITLSRRDIIRFILVEPTKRSEEIQSLLKLDEIGQTRDALKTAQNRLQTAHRHAAAQSKSDRDALQLHLQLKTLGADELREVVNKRRKVLDLTEIAELASDTELDLGLSGTARSPEFNKESALRDLKALSDAAKGFPDLGTAEAVGIVADVAKLEADPALLVSLQRRSLIEKGLDLVDGPECPLCDTRWDDEEYLRDHLKAKLVKSEEARKLEESFLGFGAAIAVEATRVVGLVRPVQKLADGEGEGEIARLLSAWTTDLEELKQKTATVEGLTSLKERLGSGWLKTPEALLQSLSGLTKKMNAKPDQTAAIAAQTFLTTAQVRLGDYRTAMRKEQAAKAAWSSGKVAYDTYCSVLEKELNALYDEVQGDFSTFYRQLNEDDEGKFTAKFTPSEGKLDLEVNFYDRGLFPPGAYHSEGHQDGMGVCLYLALMKRLFGDRFTLALLDDVVMSVDAGHRYQFCKLLKAHFPETQFIMTTHDRLWAEQMKSAGLVTTKTLITFYGWTIDTGPLVESNEEIWEEINAALAKGKVEVAAAALRHHLEYVSRHLADQLGADKIATGHFARIATGPGGQPQLLRGVDEHKDQSYVLWGIPRETLQRTLLPLGDMTKSEVRAVANAAGLATANVPESQDICFVTDNNYRRFLNEHASDQMAGVGPGSILDEGGVTIGTHPGYVNYTVGQRRGLGLSSPEPLYVKELDREHNTVTVAPQKALWGSQCQVRELNWLVDPPVESIMVHARVRYNSSGAAARLDLHHDTLQLQFEEPQLAITAGQSAGFYDGDVLMGGGVISRTDG
ncbi:MAG: chromosome segregation protein SMC [Candidatus Marinimicrobia bacterium]|nr:chromosome segregation protein SMC [Candidatus Neomarinimicrobiota bacterium]